MEQKTVGKLEKEIEEAAAEVICRLVLPSQQTMHLMSKAAVTVYEAAVENHRER